MPHQLTSTKTKFVWALEAKKAFEKLQDLFTSAPILTLPTPDWQFIIKMDASDIGGGLMLSQQAERDHKIHPSAFLCPQL